MDFKTLKEKFDNALSNIKSKFSKNSSVDTPKNEDDVNEDGMLSIDDYFSSDGSSVDRTKTSSNTAPEENKLKKGLEAAKSFVSDVNYNPFADQEVVKEVDKKILKENWFKTVIKIIIFFIMVFLAGLCGLMIYRLGYDLLNDTNISSIGGYSDYLVPENNLAPEIKQNDLVIVKTLEYYEEGDIILYEFAGTSYKLGKIVDVIRNYYIIEDSNIKNGDFNSKIPMDLVVGKNIKIIKNFKGMYDFITSPFAILLLVVIIGLYFFLLSKGKIKDKV